MSPTPYQPPEYVYESIYDFIKHTGFTPPPNQPFHSWRQGPFDPCCWLWKGAFGIRGETPTFYVRRGNMSARKFSYIAFIGAIIVDEIIMGSLCDNKSCVHPHHVEPWPTRRGTSRRLTREDMNTIRSLYRDSVPIPEIAKRFGVGAGYVYYLVR